MAKSAGFWHAAQQTSKMEPVPIGDGICDAQEHGKCRRHAFWNSFRVKIEKEGRNERKSLNVFTLTKTNCPLKLVTNIIDTPFHLNQIFTHAQMPVRSPELLQHTLFVDHRRAYV